VFRVLYSTVFYHPYDNNEIAQPESKAVVCAPMRSVRKQVAWWLGIVVPSQARGLHQQDTKLLHRGASKTQTLRILLPPTLLLIMALLSDGTDVWTSPVLFGPPRPADTSVIEDDPFERQRDLIPRTCRFEYQSPSKLAKIIVDTVDTFSPGMEIHFCISRESLSILSRR